MRFKRVYIEITNVCNLSCSFCSPLKRPARKMTVQEFEHIIHQVKPYCEYVYFHIKGEPLIHPDVFEFFNICAKNSIKANLTTNGTLIPEHAEQLENCVSLRQVNISLHSLSQQNKSEHQKEQYLKDLFNFALNCRDENKPLIVFRIWSLHKDKLDAQSEYVFNKLCNFFNVRNSFDELIKMQRITIDRGIFLSMEDEFKWPSIDDDYISDKGFCYGTRSMIGILCDGSVVPCCLDADGGCVFGNVFEHSLDEILNNEKFLSVYDGFLKRRAVADLCKKCTYRLRFDK